MNRFLRHRLDLVLACVAALVFLAWPRLDLAIAERFYVPGSGFTALQAWWIDLTYVVVARFWMLALALIGLLLLGFVPRFKQGWTRRRLVTGYLLAVLLLGPGLLANTVLKNHWGRPRPVHLVQFGGHADFTPVYQPSRRCPTNCAFVSGHAAAAFYLMAGFWATGRRRYLWGGIAFGLFVGFVRMAMGAHFLSDVLFAGFLVHFTCRGLAPLFFRRARPRPAGAPAAVRPHTLHDS
jgi:lipid A 4'-phosphatase